MVALVGPFLRVGCVKGNNKIFNFGRIRIKETSSDCLVGIALSKTDVSTDFQETKNTFLTGIRLKWESVSIEIHLLLNRNYTRVSCYNAPTSSR